MSQSDRLTAENVFVYLKDFPPAFFIEHSLFEVHLVKELGFLNLLLCDHWAWREHTKLPQPQSHAGNQLENCLACAT